MRDDLLVPDEQETKFVVEHDPRVVTQPFTPLRERLAKDKPQLVPGLDLLQADLGQEKYERLINKIHNINISGERCLIVAESELHRTAIEREALPAIARSFQVSNIRVVSEE